MNETIDQILHIRERPSLHNATLVLAFTGWMDGGDVSTGTVKRLIDLMEAREIADIDPEPFYIYNFPGSMEIAALFRPAIEIQEGVVKSVEMPENKFHAIAAGDLLLFVGREPNLRWRTFGDCIFHLAREMGVQRILFVGSFGGAVPHTREPRLYVTCSDPAMLPEMEPYGLRRTGYEGPGSFTSYLMSRAPAEGIAMISLVAEIPGYLAGENPLSIEAVTRRLAKILRVPVDLDSMRTASTEWELEVSEAIDKNDDLAEKVRELEQAYDDELLEREAEESTGAEEAE